MIPNDTEASLAEQVQQVALDALQGDPAAVLPRSQAALRDLRNSYRSGQPPDFSQQDVRKAYVLAYHPHHCVLAAEAVHAVGPTLLGIEGEARLRVAVLGAGPAAELVGLTWALRGRGVRVEADLIDRETAWEKTRSLTIDRMIEPWDVDVEVNHHTADLDRPEGLATAAALVGQADVVLAQTVLTELRNPTGTGQLLDHLIAHSGASTRLLLIDFDRLPSTRASFAVLDCASSFSALTEARFTLPAARPLPALAEHLFADEDGLRPRRTLHCGLRLIGRPGVQNRAAAASEQLTADQSAALAAFQQFLEGDGSVFVLRGSAGTGKTSLLRQFADVAQLAFPVVLLAPTGQAAVRLRELTGRFASTIHSHLYRFGSRESQSDDETAPLDRFVLREPPTAPAAYLVDEASLIGNRADSEEELSAKEVTFGDGRLLSELLSWCLHAEGSKVVFVGDPHQLPPVGEDVSSALDVEALDDLIGSPVVLAELVEVVRQDDSSAIVELARDLLDGAVVPRAADDLGAGACPLTSNELEPWLSASIDRGTAAVVATRNADVRSWNRRIRRLRGRGDTPEAGDRLLVVRSDRSTGLLNGDELTVVDAGDVEEIRVRDDRIGLRRMVLRYQAATGPLTFDRFVVDDLLLAPDRLTQRLVTRLLWVDFKRRTGFTPGDEGFEEAYLEDGRVHALRAAYAYARTCHRAQGSEWDDVVVDFAGHRRALGSSAGRWGYTAVTRARQRLHLLNAPVGPYDSKQLAEEARAELESAGMTVNASRAIQNGVQLEVQQEQRRVRVNVFRKDRHGLPSSVSPTGNDDGGLHGEIQEVLSPWIQGVKEQALDPLPEPLQARQHRIAALLEASGFDLHVCRPAEYQVRFEISDGRGSASITYSHKADGTLTERAQNASDDLSLLTELRTVVDAADG